MEECNNVQRLGANRNDMYWIVYQTTNLINNKIYIGVHKTRNPYEFDGYLGCGILINCPSSYIYGKTKFECAVKKYGTNNFKRTVIQIFDNEEDAYKLEGLIVNDEFLKRPDVYNMILGGKLPNCPPPIKTVYQYDLNGKFIKQFNSIKEASLEIHRCASNISDACTNNISCGGFYWSLSKLDNLNLQDYFSTKPTKKLYMYSIEGNFLKEFDSTRSTGYSQASQSAILGNLVDGKYYFCYVKAENYSKARDIYTKSRIIYQYDSEGNFIKEWNYLEALKAFPKDSINQAIRHKTLTKSSHYWGLQKYDVYNKPVKTASKKIGKYTLDGELVKTYENSSECYKENGKSVYKNLAGLRKTYKGHVYKYIE
jgi:hypothetical protein